VSIAVLPFALFVHVLFVHVLTIRLADVIIRSRWVEMKKTVIGIVIAVAIVLVIGFAPLMDVPYQVTETYYEDEPYEATETYNETQSLAYEVVESHTGTQSYQERRRIVIGGIVFQDEIVDVFYPAGYVTLRNTDTVDGLFGIQFAFYAVDKSDAAIAGQGLPDFDFEDYLAAEDPDSYLVNRNWDTLDWDKVMIFCEQYDGQENTTLQPSEIATVSYSVQDIDIDKMAWKWEYTITEPTNTVEKERTVTKYRQVEKERTVTHHEKGSIFEYLRSRF
jgi:hypothetical protein